MAVPRSYGDALRMLKLIDMGEHLVPRSHFFAILTALSEIYRKDYKVMQADVNRIPKRLARVPADG
ncbi:hypothetical protein [Pseudogemmobacter bohemicus]|uniref:hypothetical protein n=1 Tax=Pseudogemmobacter bohemicus TaxID=2250708 RepID=UPI000DD42CC2|nr:hypothetical protein [Pseudogemmobacter bohemicus]